MRRAQIACGRNAQYYVRMRKKSRAARLIYGGISPGQGVAEFAVGWRLFSLIPPLILD